MNPIHITKLDHIVMRVTNIEKSIRFYRDILGCQEKRISNGLYQYQAGASMIDLVPITEDLRHDPDCRPTEKYLNVDHFALTLAEFDEKAIVAYLEANNIKVERSGRRFGAQGYGPSVYFKDPDGNFIELKGPADETSQGDKGKIKE